MDPSDVIDSIFQVHRSRCRSHSEGHRRRVAPSQKAGADADVRSGRSRTGLEYFLFLPIHWGPGIRTSTVTGTPLT